MAERGWVCVSIDYRVSPKHTWPDHIVDVKRALAWIKENIAEYGGDPDFVAITGGSAGGHLSSLAALTPNDPQWQPGFEDARHLGRRRGPDLRPLRLVHSEGLWPQGVHRVPAEVRGQEAVRREQADLSSTRPRSSGYAPMRHRFSSCTARTTPSSRCERAASSPTHCVTCRRPPSPMRRSRTRSTRSTSTTAHRARTTPRRRSRSSCPGCTPSGSRRALCDLSHAKSREP